jgi:hypothetical protein
MTTAPTSTFRVQRIDREHDLRVELGTVTVGPQGEIAVIAARPKMEHYLSDLVARVNAKPVWTIKVPPPPGAEPFSLHMLTVDRSSPNLLERLRQYLEQKHDVLLVDAATVPAQ